MGREAGDLGGTQAGAAGRGHEENGRARGGGGRGGLDCSAVPTTTHAVDPGSWTPGYGGSDRAAVGGGIGLLRSPNNHTYRQPGVVDPGLWAFGPRCGRGDRDLIYSDERGEGVRPYIYGRGRIELLRSSNERAGDNPGGVDPGLWTFGPRCGRGKRDLIYTYGRGS